MTAGVLSPRWSTGPSETNLVETRNGPQRSEMLACSLGRGPLGGTFRSVEFSTRHPELWPGLTCTEAVICLGVLGPGTGPGTRDPETAEHARLVCTCKGKRGCHVGSGTSLHVTRLATTRSGTSLGEAVQRPAVVWMSPRVQICNNHPKSNAIEFQEWSIWEVMRIW